MWCFQAVFSYLCGKHPLRVCPAMPCGGWRLVSCPEQWPHTELWETLDTIYCTNTDSCCCFWSWSTYSIWCHLVVSTLKHNVCLGQMLQLHALLLETHLDVWLKHIFCNLCLTRFCSLEVSKWKRSRTSARSTTITMHIWQIPGKLCVSFIFHTI